MSVAATFLTSDIAPLSFVTVCYTTVATLHMSSREQLFTPFQCMFFP